MKDDIAVYQTSQSPSMLFLHFQDSATCIQDAAFQWTYYQSLLITKTSLDKTDFLNVTIPWTLELS